MIKVAKQDIGRKVYMALPEHCQTGGCLDYRAGKVVNSNDDYIFVHYLGDPPGEYTAAKASWLFWDEDCKFEADKLLLPGEANG